MIDSFPFCVSIHLESISPVKSMSNVHASVETNNLTKVLTDMCLSDDRVYVKVGARARPGIPRPSTTRPLAAGSSHRGHHLGSTVTRTLVTHEEHDWGRRGGGERTGTPKATAADHII